MNSVEKNACNKFLLHVEHATAGNVADVDGKIDFTGLLKKQNLDSSNKVSAYIDLNYVPCTSVDAESLFSMAKYITTDHRACLLPVTLEMLVFLKHNHRFWTAAHIHEALQLSDNIALFDDADD